MNWSQNFLTVLADDNSVKDVKSAVQQVFQELNFGITNFGYNSKKNSMTIEIQENEVSFEKLDQLAQALQQAMKFEGLTVGTMDDTLYIRIRM
jgi:glutathionyl-hydroquinone reductase